MVKEHLQQAVDTIRKLATAQEYTGSCPMGFCWSDFSPPGIRLLLSETLVRRYGPMILGVCRRILQNSADAEDAFQAVFLVLLRKGASIARRELLGNWLYGVAYKTARAARAATQKRRGKEGQVTARQSEPAQAGPNEWTALLDEELTRLPELYRAAVVLCDLQNKSRKEAASRLSVSEGTLSSRFLGARDGLCLPSG